MIINFHEMRPDSEIENEIKMAVSQLLDFSRSNHLEIQASDQFISKVNVYGSKLSFDKHIESSSDWKAGSKVPTTYVGYGEKKEFFVVLFARQSITLEDNKHDEPRFITIALSLKLNLLVDVYAHRNQDEIRIISARKATKKEAKLYEERI